MTDRTAEEVGRVGESAGRWMRVWRAGLTPSAAALLVGAVVTAFLFRDAFVAAHRTVGWVIACSVVALLIEPLVEWAGRVLPRWLAVIMVLLLVAVVAGAVTIGLVGDLSESVDELQASAPEAASGLERDYEWLADLDLVDRVDSFIDELDERVREGAVQQALQTVPAYVVTGVLMLFLLAYGRRYFNAFVVQFAEERRDAIRYVGRAAAVRGRTYLLVVLAHSVFNGTVVGLVCWRLGLPAEVGLGFAVGVLTVIPLIGVVVGGIPALLLAFGLEGWRTGLLVALLLAVLQTAEALLVRPWVDARTVRVGPSIAIVVGLLGFELYGVGGAMYGIALAVITLAALDAVGRLRGEDPIGAADPSVDASLALTGGVGGERPEQGLQE